MQGGVGPDGDVVGFTTLCPHKGFPLQLRRRGPHLELPRPLLALRPARRAASQIWGHATQNLPQYALRVDDKGDIYAEGVDELLYGRLSATCSEGGGSMAYKRNIDRLPIIPADAKEHNVVCHYCIVGCGYNAYTWDVNRQGGTAPDQNMFGVDLSQQQEAETAAWYAPSMYNIVKQDGRDVHLVIKPDKDCVVNSGLGSIRGARMAEMSLLGGAQHPAAAAHRRRWSGATARCSRPPGTTRSTSSPGSPPR